MKKLTPLFIIILLPLLSFIIYNYYIPIKYQNACNDNNLYRYRLGIYRLDTFGTANPTIINEKIDDFQAFIGLKNGKCLDSIRLENEKKYKHKIDSINATLQWKHIIGDIFINKNGDIGFRYTTFKEVEIENYFTNEGEKPLKNIIDTATIQYLGADYYKDKNYIYQYYAMAYGGWFARIDDFDYKSFQVLEEETYVKDKNGIYEARNKIKLKGVDIATFRPLKNSSFAKDKYGYFSWEERITKEDLENEDIKKIIEEDRKSLK